MIHYFFSWYNGAVWSNLLASALWAAPALFFGKRHVDNQHRLLKDHISQEHQKSRKQLQKLVAEKHK